MRKTTQLLVLFGLLAILSLPATSAHAQFSRTYVSINGQGGNDCSRGAPCLSFAAAHDATLAGGEIICLDSASFGNLIITKSITIDCTATRAVIGLASSVGITVSAGPADKIILRNSTSPRSDSLTEPKSAVTAFALPPAANLSSTTFS